MISIYVGSQQDKNDLPEPEIIEPQQFSSSNRGADTLTHEKDAENMPDGDEKGTFIVI